MILRAEQSRASRLLCLILSIILLLSVVPMRSLADTQFNYFSVEEGCSFEVASLTTSSWEKHVNIELKIKNTGDKRIDNWHLTFRTPYTIENIWNASIVEADDNGTYTIRNNYYNQDIDVDSEVTIGMTLDLGEKEYTEFSEFYLLNTKTVEIESDKYFVTYQEYSKWDNGFNGALMLSAQEYIEDWSLSFTSDYEITSISNAAIETEDETYTISNDSNSQNLSSNILLLNIQGIPTEDEFEITDLCMRSVVLAYTLTEDDDNNGVPDYMDFIRSQEGTDSVTPTPTGEPTITPVPTITEEPTVEPTIIPTVIVKPTITEESELDDFSDSDSDGLTDCEEIYYGTNKDEPDSDFDGIKDSVEVQIGYNPKHPDSNYNGISDGDEDYDDDGLTNSEEEEYGTCVFAPDSDYDGIKDYEELSIYGTDPRKEDSNDDGILDGDALELGLNPTSLDSDQDGILDIDEKTYQEMELQIGEDAEIRGVTSVEVKGEFTNLISTTMSIEDVYGKDVYSSEIEAIVGGLVSIETSSYFDEATIIFHYDEDEIGVDEEDLCILWYDEANGEYVMLDEEQVLNKEDNTVSYVTTHFSEYMLISKSKWIETWIRSIQTLLDNRAEIQSENAGTVKYIIVQQLGEYDDEIEFRNPLWNTYLGFFNHFSNEDEIIGAVVYSGSALPLYGGKVNDYKSYLMNWTYSLESAYIAGTPDVGTAFPCIQQLIENYGDGADNIIVYFFVDQDDFDLDEYAEVIEEGGYQAIVVNYNSSPVEIEEASVAVINHRGTVGELYDEILSTENQVLAKLSGVDTSLDTDGDTISDFEEITGQLLSNGTIVYTNPNTKYSDKDSLTDGDELGTRKLLKQNSLFSRIDNPSLIYLGIDGIGYYDALSSPVEEDIDKDDFLDEFDMTPWDKNPEIVYLFSTSAWFDNSKMRCQFYKDAGLNVKFVYVYNSESFLVSWNNIGIKNDHIYEQLEKRDKYDYIVKAVVICAHGGPKSIYLGEGEYLYGVSGSTRRDGLTITSTEFLNRKIESLNIYACNCGRGEDNLATDFLKFKEGIKQVIAPDTYLWYFDSKDGVGFLFTSAIVYIDKETHDDLKDKFEDGKNEIIKQTTDYNSMFDICGFMLFDQEGNRTNVYTDEDEDVFCVNVYTTNEKYNSNDYSGFFLFPQKDLSGIYHDPVLDSEV